MSSTAPLLVELDERRRRLRMSRASLAHRAGLSVPTVQRLLSGRESGPRLDTVARVAGALGVEVLLSDSPRVRELVSASALRAEQARAKARHIARLVQGTMALEAEAVGPETLGRMEEDGYHSLLAGPARRLWE